MSSRKEEEKNERIIRGLMKLPPNRRCINCNSLGPQYVCTNFWTFICITCSGIHREFTHRVKSVSMAKFTSQEVESLQKGGNQRAREIYLKDWDPQRQRLPDNSNVDKVREFIKNVYVDKRYAGAKSTDRPPRDMQSLRNHEDETRRASSYHSYSQSPPYDFQYEERRYGKHAPALTRKPGSDRGHYEGKLSSFLSPSRLSEHIYEDRFTNDGSNPRVSDYSVSSGSDLFRSGAQSPNIRKDIGSPSSETSRDISTEDVRHHAANSFMDARKFVRPQRTVSLGSFGSSDSNLTSFKSFSSVGFVDVTSEPEQSVEVHHNKYSTFPSPQQLSASGSSEGLDLFGAPLAPQNFISTVPPVNAAQLPDPSSSSTVDFFQPSVTSRPPTFSSQNPEASQPSSLDLFKAMPPLHTATSLNETSPEIDSSKNEGWATFDMPQHTTTFDVPQYTATFNMPQHAVSMGIGNSDQAALPPPDGNSQVNFEPLSSFMQWPPVQDSSALSHSSSVPTLWHDGVQNSETALYAPSTQLWDAFADSAEQPALQNTQTSSDSITSHNPSVGDQYLGVRELKDSSRDGNPTVDAGPSTSFLPSNINIESHDLSTLPVMSGVHSEVASGKSTNPFDFPYDSDMESNNLVQSQFWDMSSLQAALPNVQMSTSLVDGVTQPWFPQNPVASYVSAGPQGPLGFMTAQAPGTQIPSVPAQGTIASVGGNPFA